MTDRGRGPTLLPYTPAGVTGSGVADDNKSILLVGNQIVTEAPLMLVCFHELC